MPAASNRAGSKPDSTIMTHADNTYTCRMRRRAAAQTAFERWVEGTACRGRLQLKTWERGNDRQLREPDVPAALKQPPSSGICTMFCVRAAGTCVVVAQTVEKKGGASGGRSAMQPQVGSRLANIGC